MQGREMTALWLKRQTTTSVQPTPHRDLTHHTTEKERTPKKAGWGRDPEIDW